MRWRLAKLSLLNRFRSNFIAIHSAIFLVFSTGYIFVFSAKTDLNDFDARFTALMAGDQIRNTESIYSLRSDFLFGLGNMQQGYLWKFDPVSYMGVTFGKIYNPYLVALVISVLLFFCSYAFSRKFRAEKNVSIFVAYLVPISTIWSHAHGLVDNQNYALVPQTASLLLFSMLLLMCVENLGYGTIQSHIFWSTAAFFIAIYMCAVYTQTLILTFSLIGSVSLGSYIKLIAERRYQVILKRTFAVASLLLVLWFAGITDYLSGFYRNTAVTQNAREQFTPSALRDFGSFTFDSFFPASNGRVTQVACLLIALFIIQGILVKRKRDALYFSLVSSFSFLFVYRLWQRQWDFELGPRHMYLVWFLAPLYAAAVSQITIAIFLYIASLLKSPNLVIVKNYLAKTVIYIPITVFLIVALTSSDVRNLGSQSRSLTASLDDAEIFLAKQIALLPESQFKGRVIDVKERTDFEALFFARIPALNDISHLVTPLSFEFYEHYLFDPKTTQIRNHYKFATKSSAIYSLLGVKYMRTDSLNSLQADFGGDNSELPLKFSENDFLIPLKNTNLGNYSPTKFYVAESLDETFETMDRSDFSLTSDVVVYEPLINNLVKASNSKLTLKGGDLRIEASSPGKSMLILPLEFSNCITFKSNDPKSGFIDAFRVDGILSGLLFDGFLDVTAELRYGVFTNNGCRLKDLDDYKTLTNH